MLPGDMPLTSYLAWESGTRLAIFPSGCTGPRIELELAEDDHGRRAGSISWPFLWLTADRAVDPARAVVFRGDFIHAGCEYVVPYNLSSMVVVRGHGYVDSPAWRRQTDNIGLCRAASALSDSRPLFTRMADARLWQHHAVVASANQLNRAVTRGAAQRHVTFDGESWVRIGPSKIPEISNESGLVAHW